MWEKAFVEFVGISGYIIKRTGVCCYNQVCELFWGLGAGLGLREGWCSGNGPLSSVTMAADAASALERADSGKLAVELAEAFTVQAHHTAPFSRRWP